MALAALRKDVLLSPRYLRFAVPGVVLVVVSALFWGQGRWPWLALFVGIGLIRLPLPSSPPKERDVRPETRPGNWTGAR